MTKKERAQYVRSELDKLYPAISPFLDHHDAFTLLVSVALSAQTTDKKVNQVTPKLFSVAGTPSKMAKLKVEEIKELIKEIGLANTKAKNLKRMAEMLVENFNSNVPNNFEDLESLPGVGHKTASVVMSQFFDIPAFPVDTHIHRLMKRWNLTRGKNVKETEEDAKRIFPKESWNKLHLQIILYGREYSPARGWNLEKDFITQHITQQA